MSPVSQIHPEVPDEPPGPGMTADPTVDVGGPAEGAASGAVAAAVASPEGTPRVSRLLPVTIAVSVAGLAIMAAIDAAGRDGTRNAQLFWIGLLAVALPPLVRLLGVGAGRTERLALAVWLGLALYVVKALNDPSLIYSDEWVHRYNAAQAISAGHLFDSNSTIAVTAVYPGLAGVTAMLASATGLSVAASGLLLIGVARLLFMLALFVVVERATGSSRIAGIGCAFYAAAPNFVFWSAQYAYESLALPLLVGLLAIVAVLMHDVDAADEAAALGRQRGFAAISALAVLAIVVTHHVTSFAMILLLVAIPLAARRRGGMVGTRSILALAVLATAATGAWLAFVAAQTFSYLRFIFTSALDSVVGTISQGQQRALFQGGQGIVTPPPVERAVAILGVLVLLVLAGLGARRVWQRRSSPLMLVFLVFGVAYFASLGLRFAPGAWETGNRASSLFFVGLVVIVGFGVVAAVERIGRGRLPTAGVVVAAALAITSGVIAGWPTDLRLPWAYRAQADGATLDSQAVAIARWFRGVAPPGVGVFADEANGRTLPVLARVPTYAGRQPYVVQIYESPGFPAWQIEKFQQLRLGFAVMDRRSISVDNSRGYYFPTSGSDSSLRPPALVRKFEAAGGSRIADTGDIAIYDLRSVLRATAR